MSEYQDMLYKDNLVRGTRECEARWELMKPYLPSSGMVLDVGSNLGYFPVRLILSSETLAVVSIESSSKNAKKQADIVSVERSWFVMTRKHVITLALSSWPVPCSGTGGFGD